MNKKTVKKVRQHAKRFIYRVLGEMSFSDRVRFLWSGNYYKPLQRTLRKLDTGAY